MARMSPNGRNPSAAELNKLNRMRQLRNTGGETPDWSRIDGDILRAFTAAMTKDDGAVMFGYSRDGGAYNVKVYAGDDSEKFYCHSDVELYQFMQEVINHE